MHNKLILKLLQTPYENNCYGKCITLLVEKNQTSKIIDKLNIN
jgi:hypothetical protein